MSTVIVAISGRKQSGKTTLLNFMHGHEMKRHEVIDKFTISPEGNLVVNCMFEDDKGNAFEEMGVLDLFQDTEMFYEYASNNIWPFIKAYNFADSLKEICVNLFNVPYECVYGTDEQKNTTIQHLLWENMPGVITPSKFSELTEAIRKPLNDVECHWTMLLDPAGPKNGFWRSAFDNDGIFVHEPGPMTAREFMQFLGTDIMRKIYEPIWVNNCLNRIKSDSPPIAVIGDCRFVNEIEAVKNAGGKVVRLTRNISNNNHQSEKDADNYEGFDLVIDNSQMTIDESCEQLLSYLEKNSITKRIKKIGRFVTTAK